jgi:hypothetical protein
MCPALGHPKINNRGFTTPAGLALLAVDAEGSLHPAAGIDPIERCPVVMNGFTQHVHNGAMQGTDGRVAKSVSTLKGVQTRPKQGLVSINISKTGDERLIEQQGF